MQTDNIGSKIKDARKAKGLTQKELAKLLDCSHTTVSKYERGEIENLSRPRMKLMSEILETSPIDLFGLIDISKQHTESVEQKQPAESELSEVKLALIDLVDSLSESEAAVLLASLKSQLGR